MSEQSSSREEISATKERLCRAIAALWLNAMTYRQVDFYFLASRIEEPEDHIRQVLHDLIDGVEKKFSLRMFAAVIHALDMQIHFNVSPMEKRVAGSSIEERSDEISPHGPEAGLTHKINQDQDNG